MSILIASLLWARMIPVDKTRIRSEIFITGAWQQPAAPVAGMNRACPAMICHFADHLQCNDSQYYLIPSRNRHNLSLQLTFGSHPALSFDEMALHV